MPTFLVNKKMNPALAARVQASVRGAAGSKQPAARVTPSFLALLRVAVVLTVVTSVYLLVTTYREKKAQLEQARTALLDRAEKDAAPLSPDELDVVRKVEEELTAAAGKFLGEHISPELKTDVGLKARLARPAVYVRGTLRDFRDATRTYSAAADSVKDAFLVCLLDPPAGKTERDMSKRVFDAHDRGADAENATPNARRLFDAIAGVPLLTPAWRQRVRDAEDPIELAELEKAYDRAPIALAVQAALSDTLIYLVDEPKESGGTELDGASVHWVRVGIVDLRAGTSLLRWRAKVDPSWVSAKRRSYYARGFNGCRLALELREAVLR